MRTVARASSGTDVAIPFFNGSSCQLQVTATFLVWDAMTLQTKSKHN